MSRSFLSAEDLAREKDLMQPPAFVIDGAFHAADEWPSRGFSRRMSDQLVARWRRDPNFEKAEPILIGSAARDELCPRSDLDVLFVGDETAAGDFVRAQQQGGVRLRSRVPADPRDWSVGVEIPDLLALLEARALTGAGEVKLREQKDLILARARRERRKWLAHLQKERADRESRHDSIANVLEPNLKYGPGGLRDLDQARQVVRLFPERFADAGHARRILESYAGLLTTVRQRLHLEGQGDLLSGPAQFDLARWFGLPHQEFMRQVQRGLSRVHFYSTWIFARARAPEETVRALARKTLPTRASALELLRRDPSVLAQQRVREDIDRLFPPSFAKPSRERGRLLWSVLKPESGEDFVAAVFGSRLIDKLCPEIKPLIGLVQHDQYHRYTADVHLLQACRQWRRALRQPARLGPLAREVRALGATDRRILSWCVLYHDLMKGREGDHSVLGRQLVRRDLKAFGEKAAVIAEIEWLVEHHLELSQAAFRRNPLAPSTWSRLEEIGAHGDRLRRLAVFTAVDILATNAEAWTPWKARLLGDLLKALRAPQTRQFLRFRTELAKSKVALEAESFDQFLGARLPMKTLVKDLKAAAAAAQAPLVISAGKSLWIRFHERQDRPGLFAEFAQRLYSLGLGIRHASVQTLPGIGVYDWFEVSGRRTPAQVRKFLEGASAASAKAPPAVTFQSVSLVSQDEREWVFSFKGLDQPGCLVAAATALADEKLSITSARVHTWGRQIDDLFTVEPQGSAERILETLRAKFLK